MTLVKGVSMMEEELRQFLKEQGWNLFKRRRGERVYLYAQKWRCGDAYIGPATKLPEITKEYILEQLAKAM
jgi:hypothetical protein